MDQPVRKGNKRRGVLATAGLLLLSKLKWLLAVLKFSKFGATFISLIVSLAGYAVFYGWKFAFALVYLLFVHEMGHLVAARQKGIKTSPAVFVPFMGAIIGMKETPKDAETEAYLAYGGPLAGFISVLPAILLYSINHDPFWLLVMMLGSLLNLFNLIPVSPLDGGRIVTVLSTKIWFVGLIFLIAYTIFSPSPILFLILIFGILTWWRRVREDYRRHIITLEKQQKVKWMTLLPQYQNDLFYPVRSEEGATFFLNEGMKMHLIRELRSRKQTIEEHLTHFKSFFLPFIEDQKKLEKDSYAIEKVTIDKMINLINAIDRVEDIQRIVSTLEKDVNKHDEELKKMKTYYQADTITKWKVSIAYIGLAIVLGVIFFYSKDLLHQVHPNMMIN